MPAGGAPKFHEGLLEELLAAMGGTGDASSGCRQLVALRNHVCRAGATRRGSTEQRARHTGLQGRRRAAGRGAVKLGGRRRWRRAASEHQGCRPACSSAALDVVQPTLQNGQHPELL